MVPKNSRFSADRRYLTRLSLLRSGRRFRGWRRWKHYRKSPDRNQQMIAPDDFRWRRRDISGRYRLAGQRTTLRSLIQAGLLYTSAAEKRRHLPHPPRWRILSSVSHGNPTRKPIFVRERLCKTALGTGLQAAKPHQPKKVSAANQSLLRWDGKHRLRWLILRRAKEVEMGTYAFGVTRSPSYLGISYSARDGCARYSR